MWFAGVCGLLCGMLAWGTALRDSSWWSAISGSVCDLSVVCCLSAFRGGSWASADRALWSAVFAGLCFSSHEYHVFSVETNTIFLIQFLNLEPL